MRAHKKSASWVSPKWVESKRQGRKREEEEHKVSVNNSQVNRLDQFFYIFLLVGSKYKRERASYTYEHHHGCHMQAAWAKIKKFLVVTYFPSPLPSQSSKLVSYRSQFKV